MAAWHHEIKITPRPIGLQHVTPANPLFFPDKLNMNRLPTHRCSPDSNAHPTPLPTHPKKNLSSFANYRCSSPAKNTKKSCENRTNNKKMSLGARARGRHSLGMCRIRAYVRRRDQLFSLKSIVNTPDQPYSTPKHENVCRARTRGYSSRGHLAWGSDVPMRVGVRARGAHHTSNQSLAWLMQIYRSP